MSLAAQSLSLTGRLQDVTVSLEPGHLTAICGPNGAGKSSLLSALAGLLECESGVVSLEGSDLAQRHPRERAKALGYLPQGGAVAWDIAVKNLVALGRLPHRDAGEEQIAQALSALDLEALAERPISTLSGGEKARALLARVLAGEPRWILADEPLAALDLAHQQTLITHLHQQTLAGCGVVLVLHDLAMAMNHAHHVVLMHNGQVLAEGAPLEALSRDNIARAFGVNGEWIGPLGQMAFSCYPTGKQQE